MKRLIIVLISLLFLTSLGYCLTHKEKMDDALGRAYKLATEQKIDESKNWFRKAMEYAKEANSWQGLIDAGYGFSTLGLPEEAKSSFDSASQIVQGTYDWHGAVALGYAYASLPKEMGLTETASQMWFCAKEWAKEKGDCFGLIEAGRGLMSIGKNKEAEECFDIAKDMVKMAPMGNAIKLLVQAYRKLGREDKALECTEHNAQETPLPGWAPGAGETIRGPKTVPVEIQKTQRKSIDKDIEQKRQWELQRERLKQEERMHSQELAYKAYRNYLYYYSYPYYGIYTGIITNLDDYYIYAWTLQPVWTIRTEDEIYNWALWNLGRYTYVNGVYIAVDID